MLTVKQVRALRFIQDCQKNSGRTPTLRELGEHLDGISRGNVSEMLDRMELRGAIVRTAWVHGHRITVLKPLGGETHGSTQVPIFDADTLQLRGYLP